MLALIPFKAFIASYCYLYMRCVNAFKTDMNYNYRFNNIKFKRCLYYVNKKENCVLINILNFFFITQLIRYPSDLGLMLIIAIAFKLRCIKVRCFH